MRASHNWAWQPIIAAILVLFVLALPAEAACVDRVGNTFSAPACIGLAVGAACTIGGVAGTCVAHVTVGGNSACGCEVNPPPVPIPIPMPIDITGDSTSVSSPSTDEAATATTPEESRSEESTSNGSQRSTSGDQGHSTVGE
ncbi:MAG: hypothetical protein AAF657_28130 [Acidobacteriota bacterium]